MIFKCSHVSLRANKKEIGLVGGEGDYSREEALLQILK